MYDEIEDKHEALTTYGQIMRVPKFDANDVEKIVAAVRDALTTYPESVDIRIGAAWQRKGEMDAGSASKKVSPSSYRNSNECVLLNIMVVAETWRATDKLRELSDTAAERDEESVLAEQRKLVEQKKAELAASRDAVAEMEAHLAEMEAKIGKN